MVRGDAGVGKTSLVALALDEARQRGTSVIATSNVQSEAQLAFAGLHQLILPLLDDLDRLPAGQRRALMAAFGMIDGPTPDRFLIALGTLELLAHTARENGLVVAVGDVQWLDAPTTTVLSFVARRCSARRIVMLLEARDGHATPLVELGLPELRVEPLEHGSAMALLSVGSPDLPDVTRDWVLTLAAGNPLALVEIPKMISDNDLADSDTGQELTLTRRLEGAFGARLADLPATTRTLVVVAAENDEPWLDEVIAAAAVLDPHAGADALGPAVAAGLLRIDQWEVQFRHPLVRSAVQAVALSVERRRAHEALAQVLSRDPDRQAWHRAAATIEPNESVAAGLEAVASRADTRGGPGAAVVALARAAQLTPIASARARRQLRAAELAIDAGEPARATQLAREAEMSGLDGTDLGRARLLREMLLQEAAGDAGTIVSLTELAKRFLGDGQPELAVRTLMIAGARAWAGDPGEPARNAIVRVAEGVPAAQDDPRLTSILAFADPERYGSVIVERSLRLVPDQLDPQLADLVGVALNLTGSFDRSSAFLASAVSRLARDGRLGLLPAVLAHQAWTAVNSVNWPTAIIAAEEGRRLSRVTEQPLWEAASIAALAMVAGLRGDADAEATLSDEAEALALPLKAGAVLAGVQLTRGVTALAAGRYEVAYEHLRRTFDPADPSYHHFQRTWTIGDFVEAAIRSGHRDQAQSRFDELEPLGAPSHSSWLTAGLVYARPLLADESRAGEAFLTALDADLSGWPLYRGRLLFQYGSWLRRRRRVVESRGPLREACDWFDRHGIRAWSDRARQELRASGIGSPRASREAWATLSPQELQVAMMAAEGLTNEEIAGRLFLSRRTVGSHLYRAFPKLGVTSRSQLRTGLATAAARFEMDPAAEPSRVAPSG